MPIPALEKRRVEHLLSEFCDKRVPVHVRHNVRLFFRFAGHSVVLIERRPHFQTPCVFTESAIAKFKFDVAQHDWSLYWRDRNSQWHFYEPTGPHRRFIALLTEVDQDPTGIFWG